MVTSELARQDGGQLVGIHLNMPIAYPDVRQSEPLTEAENESLDAFRRHRRWDTGYSKQQSTRPQTLGYGLTDSPAAQCAWIVEKFWSWTDCDGHPENVLTRDEILDDVMFYWLPAAAASSARLYWESFNAISRHPVTVPTGCSIFPKEIWRPSRRWVEQQYLDVRYWNELDRGGHFAAFEQPETFVGELRRCFRFLR
jgi:hypothetical protein